MRKVLSTAVAIVLAGACAWLWLGTHANRLPSAPTPTPGQRDPREEAREVEPAALEAPTEDRAEAPRSEAAPATAPRPARVRLVDERTREPVPHLRLAVRRGDRKTDLDSDSEGVVRISAELASDPLTVELTEHTRDAPDRIQTRRDAAQAIAISLPLDLRQAQDSVAELALPIGPTYRLRASAPPGWEIAQLLASLRSSDPTQMFDVASARIRDGEPPWIRFRPTAGLIRGGPAWRLSLESPDGLWSGSALVEGNVGIQPNEVEILFDARARLDGTVRDESGATIGEGLVRIERDGASYSSSENRPLFGQVRETGQFSIRCAPPGEYTVHFHRETYRDFEERLTLAAGETRTLELVLRKVEADQLGRIEARIESVTGRFHDALYPYLRPEDPRQTPRNGRVTWSEVAGRQVGALSFDEVPSGEYGLGVRGPGLFRIEPREHRARPGDAPLVFVVHDDVATVAIAFQADDGSGGTLAKFLAELAVLGDSGETVDRTVATAGRAVFESAPVGAHCRYKLSAEGRKPVWGDLDVAEAATVRATLAPGWGTEVYLYRPDGAPISGARVYFDDVLAGESDAHGVLRVALDAEPRLARAEYRDWRIAKSSGLGAEGRFRAFEPFLNIVLEPPSQ